MANEIQTKKITVIHVSEMGFCSINCYSSAVKSESFGLLQMLFLGLFFVYIVVEI